MSLPTIVTELLDGRTPQEIPIGKLLQNTETIIDHTPWMDVKSYTNVVLTHEGANDTGDTVVLLWGITNHDGDSVDQPPTDYDCVIATDSYLLDPNHRTKQFDTRGRWLTIFNLAKALGTGEQGLFIDKGDEYIPIEGGNVGDLVRIGDFLYPIVQREILGSSAPLTYGFKHQPTEIKLADDQQNVVNVRKGDVENALLTGWADISGTFITSTGTDGEAVNKSALYVTLTNHEALPLDAVPGNGETGQRNTLTVALRDNDGLNLDSTSVSGRLLIASNLRQDWDNFVVMDDYMLMSASGTELGDTVALNSSVITVSLESNTITDICLGADEYSDPASELIKPGYVLSDGTNLAFVRNITTEGDVSLVGNVDDGRLTIDSQLVFTGVLEQLELLENTRVVIPTFDSSYVILTTDTAGYYYDTIRDFCFSYIEPTFTSISGALEWMDGQGLPDTDASSQVIYVSRGEYPIPPLVNHAILDDFANVFYLDLSVSKVTLDPASDYVDSINGFPDEVLQRHISVPAMDSTESRLSNSGLVLINSAIRDFLFGAVYTGHNSLHVAMADVCGHAQASAATGTTELTTGLNAPKFGDVALFYSLSDNSGVAIGNTLQFTDSSNAMYVYLGLQNNEPVDLVNPLPIADKEDAFDTQMHDTSMGSTLVTLVDTQDTNYKSFNIHHINLVNELPTTAWVKIYDIHPPLTEVANTLTGGHNFIQHQLKLNVAVPGLGSRKLVFDKAMTFDYGLVVRAMHTPRYSDNELQDRVDNNQVYLDMTRTQFVEISGGAFPAINLDFDDYDEGQHGQTFTITVGDVEYSGWFAGDAEQIIYYLDSIDGVTATRDLFNENDPVVFRTYNAEGVLIAQASGTVYGAGYGNTYTATPIVGSTFDYGSGAGTAVLNTQVNTNVEINGQTVTDTFTVWSQTETNNSAPELSDVQGAIFQLVGQTGNTTALKSGDLFSSITVLPSNVNKLRQLDISSSTSIASYDIGGIIDSSYGNFDDVNLDGLYYLAEQDINITAGSRLLFTTVSGYVSSIDYDSLFIDNCANNIGAAEEDALYYGTASGDVSFGINSADLSVNSRAYVFSTPAVRGNIYFEDTGDTSGYIVTLIADDDRLVSGADISLYYTDNDDGYITVEPTYGLSFELVTRENRNYWQSALYNSSDISFVSFEFHNFDLSLISDTRLSASLGQVRAEPILLQHLTDVSFFF